MVEHRTSQQANRGLSVWKVNFEKFGCHMQLVFTVKPVTVSLAAFTLQVCGRKSHTQEKTHELNASLNHVLAVQQ